MRKYIVISLVALICAVPGKATKISNVHVDLLKGYAQTVGETSDTSRYYMGRVTYNLLAEDNDSILVDFAIARDNTNDLMNVFEKTGDLGFVKQKNAGDTLKTAYFRVKMIGSIDGEFIGIILVYPEKSKMWRMADSLVGLMTVEQKQSLLFASATNTLYKNFGQENFKLADGTTIVGWRCADGPHGIRYPLGPANDYAIYGAGDTVTLFPTEAALGCSWDTDLTYRIGKAIAKEARTMGVYCILGPMCDLVINPRWGRAFETMGEDPYHVGHMAANQIRGLQSERVLATPKHFAPYIVETDRGLTTVVVQERALRELFCVPFQTCIEEGDARAIMTCYHRLTSVGFSVDDNTSVALGHNFAGSNRHTINTILRNDWGFNGIVMTDWMGAAFVESKYAYETEFDMSMPAGEGGYMTIASNVNSNAWSADYLNRKAKRVMYGKLWAWNGQLPASDDQLKTYQKSTTVLCQEHLDLSLEAARKAITLVKNDPVDGTPVLPIDKTATLKIAVVGPYANIGRPGGGGSSAVTPDKIIKPIEGIQALVASLPNITVTTDYNGADIAIVCVGTSGESEDADRPTMALPNTPVDQNSLVAAVMSKVKKTIVVYTGGSASYADKWSDAPAIVIAFYPGRFQGQAVAEVLFGNVNPGGHLNVTFPKAFGDLPKYDHDNHVMNCPSVDTAHGYFLYEKKNLQPLFWFGHGLSYTTFTYDNIKIVGGTSIAAGDRIDVHVTLTNTGTIAGDDVVQLYVKPKAGTIPRRVKDLRGFSRVSLAAKESKTVNFNLGPRDFSVYSPDVATKTGKWVVVPGEYEIIAGSTSDPVALTGNNGAGVVATITVN